MNFSFLNSLDPRVLSSVRVNGDNIPKNTSTFGTRRVDYYELDYIFWGEGSMIINDKKYAAVKGNLFIRRPGMVVTGVLPYHCYFIRLELFNSKNDFLPEDFPEMISFKDSAAIEALFAKLYSAHICQTDISPFITRTLMLQIFFSMHQELILQQQFSRLNQGKIIKVSYENITDTAKLIQNNIKHHFTLEELSKYSGYSKYALCRVFKQVIGETPINFMNMCKINYAKKLLLETNKSVKEIMLDCGFQNESYFFSLFQKTVGLKPSEYRKQNILW